MDLLIKDTLRLVRRADANSTDSTVASPSVISGMNPSQFNAANPITLFIIQLCIIIIFTQGLGWLFKFIRQPRVIAEVIGGIILGPTVMGRIPGFTASIFPPPSLPYLNLVSTIGLVLFLFLVGLEVDTSVLRKGWRSGLAISSAGILLPFGLGAAIAVAIYHEFIDTQSVSFGHFLLFTGVAISITAFPVLCRILTETKLLETRVGQIVLSAGVGNDVIGWILLALTIALVNASSGVTAVYILLCAVAWTVLVLWPGKKAFLWLCRRSGSFEGEHGPTPGVMIVMLMSVFVSAFVTDIIGVHPIFGAFLVGLIIPHQHGFARKTTEKLDDLVSLIFLPIYFVLSGLKTNLGLLDDGITWGYVIAICVIAFFAKFIGCAVAAKLTGFDKRESLAVGMLMSCKGLVELIVLNVGLQAGILDQKVFSMFVVMAVVLTFITTPLTLWVYPPKYHVKVNELKGADGLSIRAAALSAFKPAVPELGGAGTRQITTRFMVVLQKIEHLSAVMLLSQLLEPTPATRSVPDLTAPLTMVSSLASTSENEKAGPGGGGGGGDKPSSRGSSAQPTHQFPTTSLPLGAPKTNKLTFDALRLVELTGRTHSVMQSIETEMMARKDDMLQLFKQFGRLRGFNVNAHVAVVEQDQYPSTVSSFVRDSSTEMVVIPWTTSGSVASDAMLEDARAVTRPGTTPTPFDSIFAGDTHGSPVYSQFIRQVFAECPADVALFIDRGFGATDMNTGGGQHLFLPFFGGADDRLALSMVYQLCAHPNITATVMRMDVSDAEEAAAGSKEHLRTSSNASQDADEVIRAHQTAMDANQMTIPVRRETQNQLVSLTADQLAWAYYTDVNTTADHGTLSRITFSSVSSQSPLSVLNHHASAAVIATSTASWRPLVVVVGRGRHFGKNHARELSLQLAKQNQAPTVAAEIRKTVGDVATAMITSGMQAASASFLVVQAATSSPQKDS